ncbi:hypothetical protein HWV62_32537 [Athelia sp. TMB]|nr:hypothetical protein HWV62_32537 [Athelia sp. TMB]
MYLVIHRARKVAPTSTATRMLGVEIASHSSTALVIASSLPQAVTPLTATTRREQRRTTNGPGVFHVAGHVRYGAGTSPFPAGADMWNIGGVQSQGAIRAQALLRYPTTQDSRTFGRCSCAILCILTRAAAIHDGEAAQRLRGRRACSAQRVRPQIDRPAKHRACSPSRSSHITDAAHADSDLTRTLPAVLRGLAHRHRQHGSTALGAEHGCARSCTLLSTSAGSGRTARCVLARALLVRCIQPRRQRPRAGARRRADPGEYRASRARSWWWRRGPGASVRSAATISQVYWEGGSERQHLLHIRIGRLGRIALTWVIPTGEYAVRWELVGAAEG